MSPEQILIVDDEPGVRTALEAILADVQANPPDFVALVHRENREFGTGPWGEDPRFGRDLMEWVEAHYRFEDAIGAEPYAGRGFGVTILRRDR